TAPGPAYFNSQMRGVGARLVADITVVRPPGPGVKNATWLVVRTPLAGEVKNVADLQGRKLAIVAAAGASVLNMEKVLAYGGLQASDVQVEVLAYPEQLAAL